jgi:hypothetical protein
MRTTGAAGFAGTPNWVCRGRDGLGRLVVMVGLLLGPCLARAASLERIKFNHPGLVVDLGVGLWAWPMPMDWDGDGDLDLLVACPDQPYNGVYFFENPAGRGVKFPVFRPARRLGPATADMTLSRADDRPRLMSGRNELTGFRAGDWATRQAWFPSATVVPIEHPRDHFWRWVDFDGDGTSDLVVGHGDWSGRRKLCVVDWDGDGRLDLLLNSRNADFLRQIAERDGRWWFKNEGPLAADNIEGHDVSPTTVDWNADGVPDFIGGGEDGRLYYLHNPGARK